MNKLGMVLGIAAVVAIAGCKDPNWNRNTSHGNDAKNVTTNVEPTPVVDEGATKKDEAPKHDVVISEEKHCTCAPGTVHETPCACGADDCKCVVTKAKDTSKPTTAPAPEYTTYIVQRGDYLAKISKKYNITISAIKSANGMKDDKIMVGQKIKLPGKVEVGEQKVPEGAFKTAPKKQYASYNGATKEYVVKNGDTLGHIAYGNGINIRQLKELNGLTSDSLRIGQKLKVPAEKVAKAPAKKPAPVKESAPEKKVVQEKKAETPAAADAPKAEEAPKADAVAEPVVETATVEVVPETAPEALTYTVQEGEDLADVSIRWGVSAAAVRELNNLGENDKLKAGQVLKLPADAQQN